MLKFFPKAFIHQEFCFTYFNFKVNFTIKKLENKLKTSHTKIIETLKSIQLKELLYTVRICTQEGCYGAPH